MEPLKNLMERAWEGLTEGWRELLTRGSGALTHFGTGETRSRSRQHADIDVSAHRYFPRMHLQNTLAPFDVRTRNNHTAIEPTRAQQSGIQNIGPIGGSNQNHAFIGFKPVHFHQQLVERLLALIVPAAKTGAAMSAHGIDLIDKDDAWSILFSLNE